MVYLGMGARACKISRPLDAGFILFPFWVGLISVVPVKNEKKRGTDPDSASPSVVVDKSIQEREARGDHRKW